MQIRITEVAEVVDLEAEAGEHVPDLLLDVHRVVRPRGRDHVGQHRGRDPVVAVDAGQFLDPPGGIELGDERFRAARPHLLADDEVASAVCGHLRQMGDAEHLAVGGDLPHPGTDEIGRAHV